MALKPITHDLTSDGFVFFHGDAKVAAVCCKTDAGKKVTRKDDKGNMVIDAAGHVMQFTEFTVMPRKDWSVHFCSPSSSVELLEAIIAALPKGDDCTEHSVPKVIA
jgi:hypothetical protein